MKIVLIGAGNLATNLGKALNKAGYDIVQVYSRTMESASRLASVIGASPTNQLESLRTDAEMYIFSVKDSVLPDIIAKVCQKPTEQLFVHTAGSMPLDVFEGLALHYGVLYPMQTFSKEREVSFKQIPCFIEGNDKFATESLFSLAGEISERVYRLSSEDRKYLHLSAVFACNFVNHCYALSEDILRKHHLPFDVMLPLIDETARKVHEISPEDAQTGPAVRYDENVIRKQSQLLKDDPITKDIYDRMSLSIHSKELKK